MFFPFVLGIGVGVYLDQRFNLPELEPILKSALEKLKENEKKKDDWLNFQCKYDKKVIFLS